MTKKIFAISTLLLVLLVGAIFVYNFAFKKETAPVEEAKTADEGKTNASSSATDAKNPAPLKKDVGAIAAISENPVFGAVLAPDGNSIYYFSGENGQTNQVGFNGNLEKVVSTEEFRGIQKTIWNKQRNKAVIQKENGPGKSRLLLLDLAQKSVSSLKENIDSVSWSNLGDKLIYKHYDPKTKKRTLNVSDPNGSNWRRIADVNFLSIEISAIPGTSDIAFWPTPDAFVSSVAKSVSFSGENSKNILADRFGADLLWSPDGKTAAVSASDQKGGKKTDLALMSSEGGEFRFLNFPTFAKKCAWSADSKFLFCAMPGNIPETAILPNDWQEGKVQTADTFWKIEVVTGKKDRLIEADKINGSFDVLNPFLSTDAKTFFFVNKTDGKLYKLGL
jgi:hypothetical protein